MTYDQLIADVARRTGLHTEVVRRVLFHLPDTLLQLDVGEVVRTPLGVFRMTQTKEREILLPNQESTANVPSKVTVKLRSGSRLKLEA